MFHTAMRVMDGCFYLKTLNPRKGIQHPTKGDNEQLYLNRLQRY